MSRASALSVCTIVRGREAHLANLIRGLNAQRARPRELVICYMQEQPYELLPETAFPVRACFAQGEKMPLAAARNRAAEAAEGDHLLFLDVDCIASPNCVARHGDALVREDAVFLSEVFYLSEGTAETDWPELVGERHPAKPDLSGLDLLHEPDHGELWGLAFSIRKKRWRSLGGMDERFVGYGGEETDFASKLADAGVPLYWLGDAHVHHQHHTVHKPPMQHFEDIVRNARLFREKWGRWCMDYWLEQFAAVGLVRWTADELVVLRGPEPAEIAAARQPGDVRFS